MVRKVYFSFHFERDSQRVSQIRNCNAVSNHFALPPFLDHAEWEKVRRKGDKAIGSWIDKNMHGSSVLVLLYGLETHTRPWVVYELEKAHRDRKGILAINMQGMRNLRGETDRRGINPLRKALDVRGNPLYTYDRYVTYHWINDDGRNNIDTWIEDAARLAGR